MNISGYAFKLNSIHFLFQSLKNVIWFENKTGNWKQSLLKFSIFAYF